MALDEDYVVILFPFPTLIMWLTLLAVHLREPQPREPSHGLFTSLQRHLSTFPATTPSPHPHSLTKTQSDWLSHSLGLLGEGSSLAEYNKNGDEQGANQTVGNKRTWNNKSYCSNETMFRIKVIHLHFNQNFDYSFTKQNWKWEFLEMERQISVRPD